MLRSSDLTLAEISLRSKIIGVPRYISTQFLPLVERWIRCSGEEWTVNRLKAVKVDLIRKKAGMKNPTSVWIKKSKSKDLFFSGPLGTLEKWMEQSSSAWTKGLQFIQMYTAFYSPEVTTSQEQKFLSSVLSSPLPLPSDHDVWYTIGRGLSLATALYPHFVPRHGELPPAKPLMLMDSSPSKRAPLPGGTSVPEQDGIIDSVSYLFGSDSGQVHYMTYRKRYDPVLEGLDDALAVAFGLVFPHASGKGIEVGKIGLIQEPGYKLRAVANPGRVFQRVLEPLGDILFHWIQQLPWDCTFDQSKAVEPIQSALRYNVRAFCYDLSNATDLFPLHVQMSVLKFMLPDSVDVDLFYDLSRGTWSYRGNTIQWKVGQPLGLYPSFPSFGITHGILLLGLLNKPWSGEFFILGDDVVILDEALAKSYTKMLYSLGCKISLPKSLDSTVMAEFAGKLITADSVIPQMKYRNLSDDSFVDIVRSLGPRARWLLKPRQREVIDHIAIVPECLGGLGWNPEGLPLKDRIPSWVFDDPSPVARSTGDTGLSIKNLLSSDVINRVTSWREEEGNDSVVTTILAKSSLDQRARQLTYEISPALTCWTHVMGKNIDKVFMDSQRIPDLPVDSAFVAKRPSRLESWLRKLGLQPLSSSKR